MNVSLHALPILSISDHFTRSQTKVFGALFGAQQGNSLEINTCFEMLIVDNLILKDEFSVRHSQFKTVFPTYEILGFYSVASTPDENHLEILSQFKQFNENPVFLLLDPATCELSLFEYDREFVSIPFKLVTGEAELIGVDHVTHVANDDNDACKELTDRFDNLTSVIGILNSKTGALLQYLRDVEKGVLPKDHRILGKISSLLNRLPSMSESEFVDDLQAEINDVLLVSYLAALTRTTRTMSECVDKFNHAHPVGEKKNRRGLFGG